MKQEVKLVFDRAEEIGSPPPFSFLIHDNRSELARRGDDGSIPYGRVVSRGTR